LDKNNVLDTYYRENYDKLIKMARRRVPNYCLYAAEDAVQEAFTRATKYFRTYNRGENFDGWFKGILSNCINQIKKDERDRGVVSYDELPEIASEPRTIVFTKEVESMLKVLSKRDKDIVSMYIFHDFKSREISELLSVSHDVVRDVIRRFRQRVIP
jgi:RNA polymerase sigma factor (sigma-70 family)